ncbi:MAG: RNA polymerase sigma factor, partial [Eubacteriales bacterium]
LQNTYLAAFRNFGNLRDRNSFQSWLLAIAKNECRLYYRRKYRAEIVPMDSIGELAVPMQRGGGISMEILEQLPADAREMLVMYYVQQKSQAEIAGQLGIPVGTVKSRLHYARAQFKNACPPHIQKMYERGTVMKAKEIEPNNYTAGFPMELPEITITKKDTPFFEVRYAGVIVPQVGNRSYEGLYRYPGKQLTLVSHYRAERKCVINEVEGVKICEDMYSTKRDSFERNCQTSFVQMTDEYIRFLGFMYGDMYTAKDFSEDTMVMHTFLDADYNSIVNAEDPVRGNRLLIQERPAAYNGDELVLEKENIEYSTGVYDVKIGDKVQEAIGLIKVQNGGYVAEQFITRGGQCVLFRWYESWNSIEISDNYPEEYMATLDGNQRIRVNGTDYIHIEDRLYKTAV